MAFLLTYPGLIMQYSPIMRSIVALATFLLIGCVEFTAQNMNKISMGMNKSQVVTVLGEPASVSAKGEIEYLHFNLFEYGAGLSHFYVRLVSGKVESFGRVGDFDSTKDPTLNVKVK